MADPRIGFALPGRCVLVETARDRGEHRAATGYFRSILEPVRQADVLDLAAATPKRLSTVDPEAPGRKILLVEDNAVNQKVAVTLLERRGHRVVVANTGEEAVMKAAAERFDLILMDVQLPGMSGLETAAVLRARESGRRCPIVALTANAMTGDREACLAAGMDDYVSKPLRAEDLFRAIDRLTATSTWRPTSSTSLGRPAA
jgi:CheY-like chemotaxis protein